ncbi:sensor histidine kinase [Dactylosporangium sucinum]|uniref:histidine kinase n=1 Tax=Dactylosporangium sucinum TaxID=1424081 RepID=A0A917WY26_9ACTN|nr:histidine kinase [Dactylosporangium sucinum]GGM43860.1 two-component sensor histidine kinase [Dactylosporangium sucinum]
MGLLRFGLPAALVAVGLVTAPYIQRFNPANRPVDAWALALIVVAGAATAFRARWPLPTLVVVVLSTTTYLTVGYPYGPIMFSVAVAVFEVARRRSLPTASLWCGGALAVLLVHLLTNSAALDGYLGLAPGSAWVAIPFTLGVARRLVVEAGTRERLEAERRLVDAERLRLAQEVHDVVGHGLAAIQMQADIALHLQRTKPDQAAVALEAISRASADALAELRTTLAEISPDAPDRAPTPGLAHLDALVARVEAAGLTVGVVRRGTPSPVPSAVDVAAYRVLQEALTNVVKHSAHPKASVVVEHGPASLTLVVSNQNLTGAPPSEGIGITGMRRRVEHLGGTLTAAQHDRTFEVRAILPLTPSS